MTGFDYTPLEPGQLGLDPSRLVELLERARGAVAAGPLPSVQVALAREGRLALFETVGSLCRNYT